MDWELSKIELKKYILNREYMKCINLLNKNIKQILVNKIKEQDKEFEYVNLVNLRSRCIQLLDVSDILVIEELCDLQMEELNTEYEVMELMNLYERLNKNLKKN